MDEGAFAYPELHFFKSGNPYCGSWKGLNYKISPQEDLLHIIVWYGMYSSAVSEIVAQQDLPLTDEGLQASRAYLWEQYVLMVKQAVSEN